MFLQVEQKLPLVGESPVEEKCPETEDKQQITTSFERASQEIEKASQERPPVESAQAAADQEGVLADEPITDRSGAGHSACDPKAKKHSFKRQFHHSCVC